MLYDLMTGLYRFIPFFSPRAWPFFSEKNLCFSAIWQLKKTMWKEAALRCKAF